MGLSIDPNLAADFLFLACEGLGFQGPVALAHEDLDFAFGGLELLFAVCRELHALFKELDRLFEREVAPF
jgi:hypothetical protein